MIEGWLLDVHENDAATGMVAWVIDRDGNAHSCHIDWAPTLHVHGTPSSLERLEHWLEQPEIMQRFNIGQRIWRRAQLTLGTSDLCDVLEVEVLCSRLLRGLAEHIETRGSFHMYSLYSVDAHHAQRFLNEYRCVPFHTVTFEDGHLKPVRDSTEHTGEFPPFLVVELNLEFESSDGPASEFNPIRSLSITPLQEQGMAPSINVQNTVQLQRSSFPSTAEFLEAIQEQIDIFDPDIIVTRGGDQRLFPSLEHHASLHGVHLRLGRTDERLSRTTKERTVHSYGQTMHKYGSYFAKGRLHLDFANSFIVREGGLAGLFELAQHSRQSAQIISRLSPGSVISAIQMRVAMDDGVLVPWKKNRPEDTKTALELLHADRGGLYLDSQAGVHSAVIELDFASLFPSIIATRNISPETLNCTCCQPAETLNAAAFVPLEPSKAHTEFLHRRLRTEFGHGMFPLPNEKSLGVPGLNSHTCGRHQGFLGRVVAPIIERRRQLKLQRITKGDAFDLRQNALKWLLVTCFGYTGYRNARFGRIEAHEAICAWSRDILLETIEMAQEEGWEVLHAIVDCVWLSDSKNRPKDVQIKAAQEFAQHVTDQIGIPLEYEQFYEFIAFLPSRMHGAGSLTKYWAFDGTEYKVRGIELRQHSTPSWIRSLQQRSLDLLSAGTRINGRPGPSAQHDVLRLYRRDLSQLYERNIPPIQGLIARRVSKDIDGYRVKNLTYAALLRAQEQGTTIPPGSTIRYIVVSHNAEPLQERVRLADEIDHLHPSCQLCPNHYSSIAERAIWAILAPFGWTTSMIQQSGQQVSLLEFGQSKFQDAVK